MGGGGNGDGRVCLNGLRGHSGHGSRIGRCVRICRRVLRARWGVQMKAVWLFPALIAAVALLAATDAESGLPRWFELRDELEVSHGKIERLRGEVVALEQKVEALKHDPAAIEQAIREVLELARPGEVVVRFEAPETASSLPALPAHLPAN